MDAERRCTGCEKLGDIVRRVACSIFEQFFPIYVDCSVIFIYSQENHGVEFGYVFKVFKIKSDFSTPVGMKDNYFLMLLLFYFIATHQYCR